MLELNGLNWVSASSDAVGRDTGEGVLHLSPTLGHSSLYPLPAEETSRAGEMVVRIVPLDSAVPLASPVQVVKIDVEGAELDVLAGMKAHLRASADIAVIAEFGPSHLGRTGVTPKAWWDAFKAEGFRPFLIEEPTGMCRPVGLREALRCHSINIAFVRPGGAALQRLPVA